MAKGGIFPSSSGGFFQPLQSGVNKLFSGPAGARPDPSSFIQYGTGPVSLDFSSADPRLAAAGKPTVQHTQKFDAAAHKRADAHWLRMKELDAQKQTLWLMVIRTYLLAHHRMVM